MTLPVIKLLKKKSYLAMIRNAARGENYMFRNLHMTVDGIERDGTSDGTLSCAVFVTSILYLMNSQFADLRGSVESTRLINYVHASIPGTEKDLRENNWHEITEPKEGAVLVWAAVKGQSVPLYGDMHHHIGFYVGNDMAVSNDGDGRGIPSQHHWTYNDTRKVEKIYWHPALDE